MFAHAVSCFFFSIAEEFDMSTVDGWGASIGSECGSSLRVLSAVCAVHDGYVLQKSITRSPLGGSLLTKCMLKAAESIMAEKNFTIRPRYSIKRVERQPGVFEVCRCLLYDVCVSTILGQCSISCFEGGKFKEVKGGVLAWHNSMLAYVVDI